MMRLVLVLMATVFLTCSRSKGSRAIPDNESPSLSVADSASAVQRARQFWDEYRRNHHLGGGGELRTYSVDRTDSSFVVTLVPVNIATVGGGVVVEVFRNGNALIVRILD